MQSPVRVGIDVGGTFTDFIAQGADGTIEITKVPSTPDDPSIGVINAFQDFLSSSNVSAVDVQSIFHGSTVSTNAVIERDGAETGLLITDGYNAIPVVGTMSRPQSESLNPFYTESDDEFLISNHRVKEVSERLDSEGTTKEPLDESSVRKAIQELKTEGVESVAVCYLFSFMDPEHEERTREIIEEEYSDCFVSLSSEVVPKIREYERMSTTTINAYVDPVLSTYLSDLRNKFKDQSLQTDQVYLMLSHGGVVPFETAAENTSRTILSGPAAGVQGASFIGEQIGQQNLITMDMGGTSCDISIIKDGEITETKEGKLDQYPLSFPMIEINTIGAGGGTQARVEANRLRIGPESSGADPGPICYGRGGDIPTITDANVLLGRLSPETLLGGEINVALDRTKRLMENRIADPLSMDVTESAAGILEIVNDKMKKEINVMLSTYGYDAREFSLFAFGGAGPTHAARIADKLDIPSVIVPPWPGINSAAGLLTTDIQQEYVESSLNQLDIIDIKKMDSHFNHLESKAVAERKAEGFSEDEIDLKRKLDLRYKGQGYELTVDINNEIDKSEIRDNFDSLHKSRFGHKSEEPVEIVSYRVTSTVKMPDLEVGQVAQVDDEINPRAHREVYYPDSEQFAKTPIYDRQDLNPGNSLTGPAIVEQLDTTIVMEPDHTATVDDLGNIIIEVN